MDISQAEISEAALFVRQIIRDGFCNSVNCSTNLKKYLTDFDYFSFFARTASEKNSQITIKLVDELYHHTTSRAWVIDLLYRAPRAQQNLRTNSALRVWIEFLYIYSCARNLESAKGRLYRLAVSWDNTNILDYEELAACTELIGSVPTIIPKFIRSLKAHEI